MGVRVDVKVGSWMVSRSSDKCGITLEFKVTAVRECAIVMADSRGRSVIDTLGNRLSRRTSDLPVRLDEEANPRSTATALPLTLSLGLGNLEAAKSTETLETADFTADVTPEYDTTTTDGVAQLIAVGILEFGVIMHSVFIGLTLVVNEEFTTLFVVIVFHRELGFAWGKSDVWAQEDMSGQ
jgi:hypothetical protein